MTRLYEDALKLSINEEFQNIRTLLNWAAEAGGLDEKIDHAEQALRLLTTVVENLRELDQM